MDLSKTLSRRSAYPLSLGWQHIDYAISAGGKKAAAQPPKVHTMQKVANRIVGLGTARQKMVIE